MEHSYSSGCLAVIIRLLFNPLSALWLIKKKVYCCVFQNCSTESLESFCTSSWVTQGGRKPCRGISQQSTRSRSAWTMAKVNRRAGNCLKMYNSWQLAPWHSKQSLIFYTNVSKYFAVMPNELLTRIHCTHHTLNTELSLSYYIL